MASVLEIKVKLDRMWPHLNERARRMVAASEATQIGYGGVTLVSHACGLSRVTINKGIRELSASPLSENRIRQPGGGRRRLERKDPGLVTLLESLVEPLTRGDPESPLRWTCKSTRTLAGELVYRKHPISHEKVAQYLRDLGYSLQGNRKTEEGEDHPDRDAQFRHINREVRKAMTQGWPVVSVDTKKKELIGNFANKGQQWRRKKTAEHVKGHDFPDPSVPRAYPYGIYDHARNTGFVNVGTVTTPPRSRWHPSAGGGATKGAGCTRRPTNCSLRPMAAGATGIGSVYGRWSCSDWPTRRAFQFGCATFLRGPASGTKWSIVSSRSSPRTGGASHCATTRR